MRALTETKMFYVIGMHMLKVVLKSWNLGFKRLINSKVHIWLHYTARVLDGVTHRMQTPAQHPKKLYLLEINTQKDESSVFYTM